MCLIRNVKDGRTPEARCKSHRGWRGPSLRPRQRRWRPHRYDVYLPSSKLSLYTFSGDIPSSILIPACVDAVKGHKSPLTGHPVYVVGAGGVHDGRSLAANLMWGAVGVWVRFPPRFLSSVLIEISGRYPFCGQHGSSSTEEA
jgi:hypothetical protein